MARKTTRTPAPDPLPPLKPVLANRCKRDVARMVRRGRDMGAFKAAVEALCSRRPLDPKLMDHALVGRWRSYRDCHVAPDWIIIYRREAMTLTLVRTGTHADLFD